MTIVDFLGEDLKHFIDIVASFVGYFHVDHSILFRKVLCFELVDLSHPAQIGLQTTQDLESLFWGVLLDIFEPEVAGVEGLLVCDVEANDHALGVTVVHPCDLAEALLASRIPHEESHGLPSDRVSSVTQSGLLRIDLDSLDFEVIGDGGLCSVLVELLVHVSLNE